MTKWRAIHAHKQDGNSSTRDPAFGCEGISRLLRSTSWTRAYASTNIHTGFTCSRLRYTLSVGQPALAKHCIVSTFTRRIRAAITPAPYTLSPEDATHGMLVRGQKPPELGEFLKRLLALSVQFSIATPLHFMLDSSGFKGLAKVWAFRVAILELGQRSLLGPHVGRIWSCIGPIIALIAPAIDRLRCTASLQERTIGATGCRHLKRVRNCMLHEISAGMASTFNTLADELSTPPYPRRFLGSHSEKLRHSANLESAKGSSRNRRSDSSSWDDVWQLDNRLQQPQQYSLSRRAPLCLSGAVASSDTAVATVRRS